MDFQKNFIDDACGKRVFWQRIGTLVDEKWSPPSVQFKFLCAIVLPTSRSRWVLFMSQLMSGLSYTGQILGGLMVLVPFVLRDRYKEGKWFFDKQARHAGTHPQLPPAIFALLLFTALGAVSALFLGEVIWGWLVLAINILFAVRLTASAPRASP